MYNVLAPLDTALLLPLVSFNAIKGLFFWRQENPTMTKLEDVGISFHGSATRGREQLEKIDRYQELDSRVSFMSVFPVSKMVTYYSLRVTEVRRVSPRVKKKYVRRRLAHGSSKPRTF